MPPRVDVNHRGGVLLGICLAVRVVGGVLVLVCRLVGGLLSDTLMGLVLVSTLPAVPGAAVGAVMWAFEARRRRRLLVGTERRSVR